MSPRLLLTTSLAGAICLLMLTGAVSAQETPAPASILPAPVISKEARITLDRIFTSRDFVEERLPSIVWSKKKPAYYMLKAPQVGGFGKDLVCVDAATGTTEILLPARHMIPVDQTQPLNVEQFELSQDESQVLIFTNSKRVWRTNTRGDYWIADLSSQTLRPVGVGLPASTTMFAHFSPDGRWVGFVHNHNLYIQSTTNGAVRQLTTDGSPDVINGTSDWVYEEELGLRDAWRWSPDSQSIAYWQFNTAGVQKFTMINNTAGLYPTLRTWPYPKVGQKNATVRIGVINVAGIEQLPADQIIPSTGIWSDGNTGNLYPARMDWTPDSKQLVIQQFNRLQNENVVLAITADGQSTTILRTEKDAAWLENDNPIHWPSGPTAFPWLTEESGWRQIVALTVPSPVTHPLATTPEGVRLGVVQPRQAPPAIPLTNGSFDVLKIVSAGPGHDGIYYLSAPSRPTETALSLITTQGKSTRITPVEQQGWHDYDISPDGQFAIHTRSTIDQPPVIELVRLPSHELVRTLVDNKKLVDRLNKVSMPPAEFFRVDIGNGIELDGWCLKPAGFNPEKKYPLLFYVYGEPHGQTVRNAWQGQRGMWHRMLAQQGYLVVSIDTRGTPSPRGREWRKVVYRQVGILPPDEQAAAAKALLKQWPYADAERVGIWGYSGGGSSTLHAMFRHGDVYRTGIAVAGVPSQRLYDSIYQERYMGLPDSNSEGYRLGSPITHAAGLKGDLLIVHGTGDDNVHYQGAELLIDELIALNKPFSMMSYPNRSHSLSEGTNTSRHFHETMTRFLHAHLPLNEDDAQALKPKK